MTSFVLFVCRSQQCIDFITRGQCFMMIVAPGLALLLHTLLGWLTGSSQHMFDSLGATSARQHASLALDDELKPTSMCTLEEFEQSFERSMSARLEEELKNDLTNEVHASFEEDVENELIESMRSDLLRLCEDFTDDHSSLELEW